MKKISIFLSLAIFLGCLGPLAAQKPVAGRYKGHLVKMNYVSGNTRDDIEYLEYDGMELTKKIDGLNSEIAKLNGQIKKLENQNPKPKNKNQGTKTDTAQERRMWELERANHNYRLQVDSLQEQIVFLKDSVRFWKDSLNKLNHVIDSLIKSTSDLSGNRTGVDNLNRSGQHVGAYYRLGCSWLMNDLLNQRNDGELLWRRQVKLSHQIGLFWNSAPLKNTPLSFGVGLEYSRMRFAAGIGHLSETVEDAVDSDNCSYTAHLTYDNVVEDATLHYINVPITLSIGKPYNNRISGYFQITLVPSFCVGHSLKDTGNYSLAGHYSQLENTQVNLDLVEFPQLGFGDYTLSGKTKELSINNIVLLGRVSGGVYIPMCNLRRGETSQWAVRLGVNLDFALSPLSKQMAPDPKLKGASYRLNQCNILAGKGCRFVNPSLEVGIMYILGTKNR